MRNLTRQAFACLLFFAATACNSDAPKDMKESTHPDRIVSNVVHPDWVRNASIYEVNIRQYTVEGTFNAFAEHLPRLKELGVDILWFMPIHPIGEKNRKGSLGSYYSVRDYTAVNPEFGSLEDFRKLVDLVHAQGMYAIIDWVPNHTAWDHVWTFEHPEYYVKDEDGGFVSPFDWTDVIQLDYDNQEMRKDMIASMKYWLTDTGIDGFRCDVAHMVPVDFWDQVRPALEAIKPVFLLAESDQYFLQENAFDATYGWPFHHLMNDIASGRKTANAISYHFSKIDSLFPEGAIIMQFTSNHDENSWNGTVRERLDGGVKTFAVLAATVPGMPLIYSGQEAGLDKRLQFFEKDPIDWKEHEMFSFYRTLLSLKKRNTALWNGSSGGSLTRITSTDNKSVYAFLREKGNDRVLVILNLTGQPVTVRLRGRKHAGSYTDVFSGEAIKFRAGTELDLGAWEYRVYEQ
jgi:glycosidase